MKKREIDEGTDYTSFADALRLVRESIVPAGIEELPVRKCAGHVSAEEVFARITSPATRTSLKDGFAVRAEDTAGADNQHPCELKIVGSVFAGGKFEGLMLAGQSVKVTTGAPVPDGADAVVPSELCEEDEVVVRVQSAVKAGQDIAPAGDYVNKGEKVIESGMMLTPVVLSYAATGGMESLRVYRKPRFGLIAIGDELAEPGKRLKDSQIYASNLVHNEAWLEQLGIAYESAVVPDNAAAVKNQLSDMLQHSDAIITSGGVMDSERDVTVEALYSLGWEIKFRHVRMSPGKATAFGLLQDKPVFCFSGGLGSNTAAFLEFALPAIYGMMKLPGEPLRTVKAVLGKDMKVRNPDWTEFRYGRLEEDKNGHYSVTPVSEKNRMKSMTAVNCLLYKPEGRATLKQGQIVGVQLLPG